MKNLLIKFLEEKGIKREFDENIKEDIMGQKNRIDYFYDKIQYDKYAIEKAFVWAYAKNNPHYDYWDEIANEWQNYLNTHKNKI